MFMYIIYKVFIDNRMLDVIQANVLMGSDLKSINDVVVALAISAY